MAIPLEQLNARHQGLRYSPGTRVLDTVTGDEATVIKGVVTITLEPAREPAKGTPGAPVFALPSALREEFLTIRYDSGATIERRPSELLEIKGGPLSHLATFHPQGFSGV